MADDPTDPRSDTGSTDPADPRSDTGSTDPADPRSATGSTGSAGSAYVVAPDGDGPHPAVLVLHAWWGLTPFFHDVCDRLADEGFVALAPDLHGDGRVADTPDEAEALLASTDPNVVSHLVVSSLSALRGMPITDGGPVGVVGYSMGASWAMWASARFPDDIAAVVTYYGLTDVDFATSKAAYLGHFAEHDEFESDDDITYVEAQLHLVGREVEFHRYPETGHWFAEHDRAAAYSPTSAQLAWDRTVGFLHAHLDSAG